LVFTVRHRNLLRRRHEDSGKWRFAGSRRTFTGE
jgi:hypothetical protein